jgi:ribosomal protein S18 acetylase RimI-like enzyme
MLRLARAHDADLIAALWALPQNAMWIEPPDDGEIGAAIAEDSAFLWEVDGQVLGFATAMTWVPQVWGLSALVVTRPGQGEPLLRAVLAELFGPRAAHRVGFDVTADNARALRLYQRLGFQREGLIRECWLRPDGQWVDCALLGLLRREWTP